MEKKEITRALLKDLLGWQNLGFGYDLSKKESYGFDVEFDHFLTYQEAEKIHRAIVCSFKETMVTWDFNFHLVVWA